LGNTFQQFEIFKEDRNIEFRKSSFTELFDTIRAANRENKTKYKGIFSRKFTKKSGNQEGQPKQSGVAFAADEGSIADHAREAVSAPVAINRGLTQRASLIRRSRNRLFSRKKSKAQEAPATTPEKRSAKPSRTSPNSNRKAEVDPQTTARRAKLSRSYGDLDIRRRGAISRNLSSTETTANSEKSDSGPELN